MGSNVALTGRFRQPGRRKPQGLRSRSNSPESDVKSGILFPPGPDMTESASVTSLLREAGRGDRQALDRLVPMVYDTLRGLAHRALRHERPGHTLNTTALAHEAYLKLIGLDHIAWQDRSHFFAMAARAMRHILVDYAVARKAQKRGGGAVAIELDDAAL